MTQTGDRVIVLNPRIDQAPRRGEVIEVVGSFLRVRWENGSETLVSSRAVAPERTPEAKSAGS